MGHVAADPRAGTLETNVLAIPFTVKSRGACCCANLCFALSRGPVKLTLSTLPLQWSMRTSMARLWVGHESCLHFICEDRISSLLLQ